MPTREPCPFCLNLNQSNGCIFVHRDEQFASFVNPAQHQPGSLLVIPVGHYPSILDLPEHLIRDIYAHVHRLSGAAVRAFGATGVNVFQNNGLDAGQTVPHYHVHVVPRYAGGDPAKVFSEKEAVRIDIAERQRIADAIRAFL